MCKTLVILVGNARGGEFAWKSMYKNLLEPYEADLALCFGKNNNRCSLHDKCKYFWEVPEYDDWIEYLKPKFPKGSFIYKTFFSKKVIDAGSSGGILNFPGSGILTFIFKDILKNEYRNILEKYDRIILTRSDFFYIDKHPILDPNCFWIVDGCDYGGIDNRHHIFPSKNIDSFLSILDYLNTEESYLKIQSLTLPNPEAILKCYFEYNGVFQKIKRFPRVHFLVSTEKDSTRWGKGLFLVSGEHKILAKYLEEIDNLLLYKRQFK